MCRVSLLLLFFFFFFFNDTATTEIYTLSLHDALPISREPTFQSCPSVFESSFVRAVANELRSEEHTSELQSRPHLVCRLLLEKKKQKQARDWLRRHFEGNSIMYDTLLTHHVKRTHT